MKFSFSRMGWLLASLCLTAQLNAWAAGDISVSPPSLAERLQIAKQAMETKDWRNAAFQLDQALYSAPRNADVHNLLGYYNRKKPNPDLPKAFEHYNLALQLDPRHKGAHEYIGEAYLMDKKPEQAQAHLAQLEAICGNRTCEEYEDLAAAIAAYKKANP